MIVLIIFYREPILLKNTSLCVCVCLVLCVQCCRVPVKFLESALPAPQYISFQVQVHRRADFLSEQHSKRGISSYTVISF